MSAEMGAGMGAVASLAAPAMGASIASAAEIGPASIPSMGAETFATQIPVIYSGIPSPIEPAGIETLSPSSNLISELESPLPTLGEFTIEDLIGSPQTIDLTHLEPSIDTSPTFIEEITQPGTWAEPFIPYSLPEVEKPQINLDVITVSEPAAVDTLPKAEQEIGNFTTDLMTLGTIGHAELAKAQSQADQQALEQAIATLASFQFSEEETQKWETKLQAAVQIKIETETGTGSETAAATQTQIEAMSEDEPPIITGVATEMGEGGKEEFMEKVEEETVLLYKIGAKVKSAEKTNKRRSEIADA